MHLFLSRCYASDADLDLLVCSKVFLKLSEFINPPTTDLRPPSRIGRFGVPGASLCRWADLAGWGPMTFM